jgi:hypothetical protein
VSIILSVGRNGSQNNSHIKGKASHKIVSDGMSALLLAVLITDFILYSSELAL